VEGYPLKFLTPGLSLGSLLLQVSLGFLYTWAPLSEGAGEGLGLGSRPKKLLFTAF